MKTLEKNIVNQLGQRGQDWLLQLPELVSRFSEQWDLSNVIPVEKMNWNYVATAVQYHKTPVMLKISCNHKLLASERAALIHFAGNGAIHVYDYDDKNGGLLLQQAIPGDSLKLRHPDQLISVMDAYAGIIHKIADAPANAEYEFKHMREWLSAIDLAKPSIIPQRYLDKAKEVKDYLLKSSGRELVLHGDLHLENILNNGLEWLAIDPQGIIGEIEFEVAAFDLIDNDEIARYKSIANILHERITMLAAVTGVDESRLTAWIYLRIMMSALWFIEDNGDPAWPLMMAGHVYQLLG